MRYDYDLISIGLGPAGMAVSAMGRAMGLTVCAIERRRIGGECMNMGCIPSKALLRMAQFRHHVSQLAGMRLTPVPLPAPGALFEKIQSDLTFIRDRKTMKMFENVDLVLGEGSAEFVDPHTVRVGDRRMTARRIFIATGTRPAILPIPGLKDIPGLLTNENLFELEAVPESMIVLGGGAIACEMAQAFQRLGCQVTMIQRSERLLSRMDSEAASVLEAALRQEGVHLLTGETGARVDWQNGQVVFTTASGSEVRARRLLAATGRCFDFAALNLERAGVQYDDKGITVDRRLRTSQRHIYAIGDCNGRHLFSHAAMHQGMIALMNTLIPGPFGLDFRRYAVPATVFTEPAVSIVGRLEPELDREGVSYEVVRVNYADYGAAIAENLTSGFVKVLAGRTGRILGAVIVGEGSGEMINEWALAVQKRLRLSDILFLQHSFPTMGFLSKQIAETWMMGKMRSSRWPRLGRFLFRRP